MEYNLNYQLPSIIEGLRNFQKASVL